MRFWSGLATMALSVSLLAACGGGSSGSKTAQLRLLNASVGYPSLDLSVNSTVQNAAVAYGAASISACAGRFVFSPGWKLVMAAEADVHNERPPPRGFPRKSPGYF